MIKYAINKLCAINELKYELICLKHLFIAQQI